MSKKTELEKRLDKREKIEHDEEVRRNKPYEGSDTEIQALFQTAERFAKDGCKTCNGKGHVVVTRDGVRGYEFCMGPGCVSDRIIAEYTTVCPGCLGIMTAADDFVECSKCGEKYHRGCFGDVGTDYVCKFCRRKAIDKAER